MVSTPQKGRSKSKGGIPLDELLAAHAAGRPARATKKTPARAPAAAKPAKTKPKKAPGRRLPRRDDVQVLQELPKTARRAGGLRTHLDGRSDDSPADISNRLNACRGLCNARVFPRLLGLHAIPG
jgi:hypothetical protein